MLIVAYRLLIADVLGRPTSQWFANLEGIKDDAIEALKDVTFYPPQCKHRHLE